MNRERLLNFLMNLTAETTRWLKIKCPAGQNAVLTADGDFVAEISGLKGETFCNFEQEAQLLLGDCATFMSKFSYVVTEYVPSNINVIRSMHRCKVHLLGYNSVADSTGLSSFVLPLLPLKSAKSRVIPRKFKLIAVQGHPRSSTLVPIESAYASSYWTYLIPFPRYWRIKLDERWRVTDPTVR